MWWINSAKPEREAKLEELKKIKIFVIVKACCFQHREMVE